MLPWEKYDLLSSKIYFYGYYPTVHPAPPSSTQFHPSPPSSFQSPPSFLQHPQQYSNKTITCTWAVSQNLGRKIQICPFWMKICTHGILEVLISNPDLDFWNQKVEVVWKLAHMVSLIPTLVFWISNPNFLFGQIWAKKVKIVCFVWKLAHMVSKGYWRMH